MHEFEDIKEYVSGPTTGHGKKCPICRSSALHFAVFYPNDGYSPISNGVWLFCTRNRHTKLIVHDTWTADDDVEVDQGTSDDAVSVRPISVDAQRESMLREFAAEREEMERVRLANARRFGVPIDAYGMVRECSDPHDLKGSGGAMSWHAPEREILVLWRSVYYRKRVPAILSDDGAFAPLVRGIEGG